VAGKSGGLQRKVRIMNPKPILLWRTTTVALVAVLLGAVLPAAPIAASGQIEDRETRSASAAPGSSPAVYVINGRVVAIRRDPLPAGAYGSHGVDYAPDMTAWVLGPGCAQ
jgi:hypothetical protein